MAIQRGRKTIMELQSVSSVPGRAAPLEHLTIDQSEVWHRIVAGLPADWFGPESYDLLAMYCEHVITSRQLSRFIELAVESDDLEALDTFIRIKERETRVMLSLATKMRLTQQATYDREKVKRTATLPPPPWSSRR